MIKIFIGNLSWGTDSEGLRQAFAAFGEVVSANVVIDRKTGRSRGFGFVEMMNRDDAELAIKELNGSQLDGRNIRVNESQPNPKGHKGGYKGGFRGNYGGRRNHGIEHGQRRPDWDRGNRDGNGDRLSGRRW